MSGFGSAYIGERTTPSPTAPIQDLVRVNVDAAVKSHGLGTGADVHPYTVTIVPQVTKVEPAVSGSNGGNPITITGTGFATFDPVAEANGESTTHPPTAAAACGLGGWWGWG